MFSFKKQDKDKKDEFKIKLVPCKELTGLKALSSENKVSLIKVGKVFNTYLECNGHAEQVFLLCQAQSEVEGKSNYKLVLEKVKPFLTLFDEEQCTIDHLQTLINVIKYHKDYNDACLMAILGTPAQLEKPEIKGLINEADVESGATPLHVAVKFGKVENVKELLKLGAKIDAVDKNERTIFHYAAVGKESKMIEVLGTYHATELIDKLNNLGETALHEACTANLPNNVEALLKLNFNPMTTGAQCTRYPIHCAVESNSLKSIELLCASSPDQAKLKDKKNFSPLHLATSPEAIDILCDFGGNLEDKDFKEEDTPLLKKIRDNAFAEAARLLARGADVKACDKNNNIALTIAVVNDKPDFVMLLLLFGADHNEVVGNDSIRHKAANTNLKNKDAIIYYLHHSGAARCNKTKKDCNSYCSHKGSNNGKPMVNLPQVKSLLADEPLKTYLAVAEMIAMESAKERKMSVMENHSNSESRKSSSVASTSEKERSSISNGSPAASVEVKDLVEPIGDIKLAGHRVLTIDGGGLEGLFIIRALLAIEEATQQPLKNCFDWIAGTGAGAYIALSLLQDKSLREIFVKYWEMINKVLVSHRPYNAANFEKVLLKHLGEKTKMFDIASPKTIVYSSLMDKGIPNLHLFRNYELPNFDYTKVKKNYPTISKPSDQLIWQAARASGLGFGYFDICGAFSDGCMLAYNPTLDVMQEINEFNFAHAKDEIKPIHVVVSVGVKQQPQPINEQPQEQHKETNNINNHNVDSNGQTLAKKSPDNDTLALLFNQQLNSRVVEKSRAWCNDIKVPYFRIQPPYPEPFSHNSTVSSPPPTDCNQQQNCNSNGNNIDIRTIVTALWEADMFLKGKSGNLEQLAKLIF